MSGVTGVHVLPSFSSSPAPAHGRNAREQAFGGEAMLWQGSSPRLTGGLSQHEFSFLSALQEASRREGLA